MSLSVSRNALSALHIRLVRRNLSSAPGPSKIDPKTFSKTLLLPKTPFPLWADPAKSEELFRRKTCDKLYQWQAQNAKGPWFVMHDGPPYANGHLHIGHALNKILKDIINRFHVSVGDRVHYFPGWDCHGLPIENKALQDLKEDPHSLPASTIRTAARKTAEREMKIQREEFEKFGIMADWSEVSTYRTLDHQYEMRQLRIFQQMVAKGLIYRDYRPVYFSPSSRSALAEAELVYKDDHISHSVYVVFTLDPAHSDTPELSKITQARGKETIRLLVWTTTPWTLSANMGIAVHPDLTYTVVRTPRQSGLLVVAKDRLSALERVLGSREEIEVVAELPGSGLVGLGYRGIFATHTRGEASSNFPNLSVTSATHVTSDSGTGLVHCAPAHGAEDYLAFRSQGLLSSGMLCHVDGEGKFSQLVTDVVPPELGGDALVGLEVLKGGSKAIVKILQGCGALLAVERIKHRYPYDWKTNEPVIVTATSQWFANLDNIKENALTALEEVTFFPPASRNRLTTFVRSRSEWCISRQRVWGVPIPSLHHVPSGTTVLTLSSLSHILRVLDKNSVGYWWDGPVSDFIAPELAAEYGEAGWKKGTNTMDVWFDSGTSWSMLSEMEGRKHRADICIEGSDQHRGWFQSQLLTAIGTADDSTTPASPYGTLITHGMVLDETGKKMSKSLGNVVSPLTVINGGVDKKKEPAYGADVLRLWAATVEYWRDMSIGPTVLAQTAESMRKIRNSARFLLGNIGSTASQESETHSGVEKKDLGLAERYVMHELYKLERTALEGYRTYNFPRVMVALTNFANITLSSLYFDITKDVLYANDVHSIERRVVVDTLKRILQSMTSVLAPVLPYLAEEIHAHCTTESSGRSFFTNKWESLSAEWDDPRAEKDMGSLLTVRSAVLSLLEQARGDKNLKSSLEAQVVITLPSGASGLELVELLRREANFLKTLFIVSDMTLTDKDDATSVPAWGYSGSLSIPGSDAEIGLHIRPASLHKCPRCWTYTRHEQADLCSRCADVVRKL
ncbi:isoleucyl-tRNA synthetase [Imleria badia]|nr:isoleucyl-tRNA synthetase [Imleria badia]